MKILITENQLHKVMFNYLDRQLINGVDQKQFDESREYRHIIFFIKNNERLVALIALSANFWIRESIWNDFNNVFSLNYSKTKSITNLWLIDRFELNLPSGSLQDDYWDELLRSLQKNSLV